MRLATAVFALAMIAGCDQAKQPTAEAVDELPPRVMTPREQIVQLQAQLGVVAAIEASANDVLRSVEELGEEVAKAPPADLVTDSTRKFTLFFGANNHGERNDCGCRMNPLGGLGRRHTMLEALENDHAAQVWEESGPAIGPVFHVDAGDAFFANNTADRGEPDTQKVAKYDAASVALAFATFPPDAYAVGESDLVFGAKDLEALAAGKGFPLLSANLRGADGELVFAPSVVIERAGLNVAFVGLTNHNTRRKDFYSAHKLTVDDPLEAATRAIGALPAVDAVVLLSNLGRAESAKIVTGLRAGGARVEFVVVSGSNGKVSEPEFFAGVPVMEPMSRGKYVGRADLWLNGNETAFRNASVATPAMLHDYRRAVRSYWTNRKQVFRERLKIAELELSLETLKVSQQADVGAAVEELTKRRVSTIEAQRKRLETFQTRQENSAEAMMVALAKLAPPGAEPTGDDWVGGEIVPVKIEFVGDASTRKVLDAREKKRPAATAGGLKLPAH